MHHQIGITPNRTGEMEIVIFRQPIMPQRLRQIARAFQTFEQTNFQRLLFRFPAKRSEQTLELGAMRKIADLVVKTEHELAIFRQLLRVWIFVDTVDRWNAARL